MPYFIHALYREGGAEARLPIRRAHIQHMLDWLPRTVFGGAVKSPEGSFLGMVVALDVATEAEARGFIDNEPYARAGLFASVNVLPLVQMTPPYTREVLERELEKSA